MEIFWHRLVWVVLEKSVIACRQHMSEISRRITKFELGPCSHPLTLPSRWAASRLSIRSYEYAYLQPNNTADRQAASTAISM